jgi:general stress protein 26
VLKDKVAALAGGADYAVLTTPLGDGTMNSHMMWVGADADHLLINTEIHRRKFRNMAVGAKVTVVVFENPFSWVEVRGTVVGHVRGAEARAHIDSLAQKYNGTDYSMPIQSERVIVQIRPDVQFIFPPAS